MAIQVRDTESSSPPRRPKRQPASAAGKAAKATSEVDPDKLLTMVRGWLHA